MKPIRLLPLILSGLILPGLVPAAPPVEIQLVDGTITRAHVLFQHPNAPRLVVRSVRNATLQSLPLDHIRAIRTDAGVKEINPARELTEDERREYDRNTLWADEAVEGTLARWADETWDPRPVLVWAHPGRSGNAMQPDNWLDAQGNPLSHMPWNARLPEPLAGAKDHEGWFDGDVLLPVADKEYMVIQPGNRDHLKALLIRHLTVERNASYRIRYTIGGNLWVKDGAHLGEGTQTGGFDNRTWGKDTFARFCNHHDLPEPAMGYAEDISHWVHIRTGDESSLELIGICGGPSDRLTLFEGTMIVAEDSFIGNGNRGSFYSQAGTTLILLDGAGVGCPSPTQSSNISAYGIDGTLWFGAPERPLTRDLIFGGNYFDVDRISAAGSTSQRTSGASFVLGENGRMVVHSSDPATARVVFRPRSKHLPNPHVEPWNKQFLKPGGPADPKLWEQPGVPDGVVAVFRGETDFNGVVFDGFYRGGILVDPAARAEWRNVSFGEENHGPPETLFAVLPEPGLLGNPLVRIEPSREGPYTRGDSVGIAMTPVREEFEIRYTLDGTVPDAGSLLYREPFEVSATCEIRAGAFLKGMLYGLSVGREIHFAENPNHAPTARIVASASFGRNPPELAVDRDPITYWRGGTEDQQHLELTWDEPVTLSRMKLVNAKNMVSWSLKAETGGEWRVLATGTDLTTDLGFEVLRTRRVRLEIVKQRHRPEIPELELLEDPDAVAPMLP